MKGNSTSNQRTIGFRAIILSILLIPINVYWIAQLEVVRYTHPTLIIPFFNVVFIFLFAFLFNLFSEKVFKRTVLNQGELITIYVMLSVSSGLASIDMLQILVSNMGHAFYFATPENEWKELIWDNLPRYLVVNDETALEGYYKGSSSLYFWRNIKPWVLPVLIWLGFITLLVFTMLCLCSILRKQWTEREKLTYPMIRLPLEMTTEKSKFFRNKLMWIGFGIAAFISVVNGLKYFVPTIPEIPVKRRNLAGLTERPWSLMGGVRLSFYPFVIGMSFLIPIDLLLSCWSFYWFYKAELMVGGLVGFRSLPNFPYQSEQAFGAVVSVIIFSLWMGREHLKNVIIRVFKPVPHEDSDEPLSYRTAVIGFVVGLIILSVFSSRIGMSIYMIPIFFLMYYLIATFITRMRAELGLSVHSLSGLNPRQMMITALGSQRIGKNSLTAFAMYSFFNRTYRSHPMPHMLEGMKMTNLSGYRSRRLSLGIVLSAFVTVIACFWIYLHLYYKTGASSGYFGPWTLGLGNETYSRLQNWIYYPTEPNSIGTIFMGVGFLIASALTFLRTRFLWFPFHPLGYAMAGDWGMYNLWSCFFASYMAKWIILKYGGLKLYRRSVPLFLGLALGDLTIGSIWSIIGVALDTTIYQPFP
ncbi:hypothetical protein GF312_21255 [Candidatus Poribacteria bacterium]|nr:hypothetical protein [Candidatus Poribacteria bacterium]